MQVRTGAKLLSGLSLLCVALSANADVFINEIHYDNDGTDTGEAVEVIAPAGTSLAGWTVQLYNGADGKRYSTLSLSGTVADQCNGFGTAVVAASGMQNGAPDGLALVNASGVAVQFLSYEGSFSATDGAAAGMASSNIGQSEAGTAPAGSSLQLGGSGTVYADFAWQGSATSSFGACNAGQTLNGGSTPPPPPPPPTGNELANGVTVSGLAASKGSSLNYTMAVPTGATNLGFVINGGSGDADLYVKFGSAPTTSSYDCRPFKSGNSESCSFASPQGGTWYVMIRADRTFSGLNLTGSFVEPSTPPPPPPSTGPTALSKGVAATGIAAATNEAVDFTLEVPAGATGLSFVSSGGTGDADMYVKFGAAPTTTTYDCRPYASGNNETCSFASPQAGTWYVSLRAYTSFSGVSLVGDYTPEVVTPPPGGGGGGTGGGTGYYASVDTSSPAALRASLHEIIDDHLKYPYSSTSTDTWNILDFADQDPLNSGAILDIYKNTSYAKAGGGNNFYNREHTWPKSLGFPDDTATNYPYTDTHMLMLSDISYNSSRGNLPFGNCNASCTEYPTQAYNGQGGGSGVFPGNSNWSDGVIWQVWSKLKGDVARALLYMDVRYEGGVHGVTGAAEPDLRLTDDLSLVTMSGTNASVAYMGKLSVLLQWNADDPVTEAEVLRNDAVQSYQGNRNPFVDHPEWVACVFQNVCN